MLKHDKRGQLRATVVCNKMFLVPNQDFLQGENCPERVPFYFNFVFDCGIQSTKYFCSNKLFDNIHNTTAVISDRYSCKLQVNM